MLSGNNIPGVNGDYRLAATMVVFSHGFRVRRDSRGMINDLIAALPLKYGYVAFDYNHYSTNGVVYATIAEQCETLATVLDWLAVQPLVLSVQLCAHSLGCMIVSKLGRGGMAKVLFLAPPLVIGDRIQDYFTHKPGAVQKGDKWDIPRSDGTRSLISIQLFENLASLDATAALQSYAQLQPYTIVKAGNDEVVGDLEYQAALPLLSGYELIVGADHNFTEPSRQQLIELFCDYFLR
jgi:hypothetical protein